MPSTALPTYYVFEGKRKTIKGWAEAYELHPATLAARLRKGASIAEALTERGWGRPSGRPLKKGSLNYRLLEAERRLCRLCPQPAIGHAYRNAGRGPHGRALLVMADFYRPCDGTPWTLLLEALAAVLPPADSYQQWGTQRLVSKIEVCLSLLEREHHNQQEG